jgi:serine/threonine protein kinase
MQGKESQKQYKKIRQIGQGGYGKILLIEDLRDMKTYALKKMSIDVKSLEKDRCGIYLHPRNKDTPGTGSPQYHQGRRTRYRTFSLRTIPMTPLSV